MDFLVESLEFKVLSLRVWRCEESQFKSLKFRIFIAYRFCFPVEARPLYGVPPIGERKYRGGGASEGFQGINNTTYMVETLDDICPFVYYSCYEGTNNFQHHCANMLAQFLTALTFFGGN